jgi:Gtr1/RagA G protein conserved region
LCTRGGDDDGGGDADGGGDDNGGGDDDGGGGGAAGGVNSYQDGEDGGPQHIKPRILLMGPRRSGKTSIQRVVFYKVCTLIIR